MNKRLTWWQYILCLLGGIYASLTITGCEVLIRRPPVKTDLLRGQAEVAHAQAKVLLAHAAIAENYAACTEGKAPKGILSLANLWKDCGKYPTSPVTVVVTDSHKQGEVSQFKLLPDITSIIPFLP